MKDMIHLTLNCFRKAMRNSEEYVLRMGLIQKLLIDLDLKRDFTLRKCGMHVIADNLNK